MVDFLCKRSLWRDGRFSMQKKSILSSKGFPYLFRCCPVVRISGFHQETRVRFPATELFYMLKFHF